MIWELLSRPMYLYRYMAPLGVEVLAKHRELNGFLSFFGSSVGGEAFLIGAIP